MGEEDGYFLHCMFHMFHTCSHGITHKTTQTPQHPNDFSKNSFLDYSLSHIDYIIRLSLTRDNSNIKGPSALV